MGAKNVFAQAPCIAVVYVGNPALHFVSGRYFARFRVVDGEVNVFPWLVGELCEVSLHRQQMIGQLMLEPCG